MYLCWGLEKMEMGEARRRAQKVSNAEMSAGPGLVLRRSRPRAERIADDVAIKVIMCF